MTTVEMVTIPKSEYKVLLESERFLLCLETCGVDNWCGYSLACDEYYGEDASDDDSNDV